jgi:catechol 2,3-dioxygenase
VVAVSLKVADLDRAIGFYRDVLGFDLMQQMGDQAAFLSAGGYHHHIGLNTWESKGGSPPAPGTTGLFHLAIRYPTRAGLADALKRLVDNRVPISGASDHGVSEAIYLHDPDGNGIELYRDRPREEWPRAQGKLRMTSDPLDLGALLSAADQDSERLQPLADGTVVGHVHLHVPHLEPAREFYCDTLGFDLMQRLGASAMFVSAGGYHHHLGFNTWLGIGAPPPPSGALGLERFRIRLGSRAALDDVRARLAAARVPIESEADGLSVMDPAAHRVTFEGASG